MITRTSAILAWLGLAAAAPAAASPHNVILFVADGLRSAIVDPSTAPTMASVAHDGVFMSNSHALFPTFTTANASVMATGHYLGDSGDFSNTLYVGFEVPGAGGSVTPFIESDPVLGDIDAHFGGDYLDEATILALARAKNYGTAAIGKLGPTLIFDHTQRTGETTIVIDDATGSPKGIPLSAAVQARLDKAGLPAIAPTRGANGKSGNFETPGTKAANFEQQDYFVDVATKVVLPLLAERKQPFALVFWSRDPDGTQHNQGDSLGQLQPGINGPTSLAAIRNADRDLGRLIDWVRAEGLADTTDIVVTADHGFSTIAKTSATSAAAKRHYPDVAEGQLPPGFLALDLSKALGLPLIDPDTNYSPVADGSHSRSGNGLIGGDRSHPKLVVAANGGSDLIYLPDGDKAVAESVVKALFAEDYVSGIFVDSKLGSFPGTLTLDDIGLAGSAVTPTPSIAVSFRSFVTGCAKPTLCAVEIADTPLQQGQGMHGSFSRADTWNFMAATGPDFKQGYLDITPTSNADIGRTIAHLLDLKPSDKGHLVGRVLEETLAGGKTPEFTRTAIVSTPGPAGVRTVVHVQTVGATRYFDEAGFPGHTVGVTEAGARPK